MVPTATEAARAVRDGERSPVEMVEEALERAERWQALTNAFSQIRPQDALDEARAYADALARGEPAGLLAGVPVAVKDLFDVSGWETSGCCLGYRGNVTRRDSEVVRRLRAAGAVIVGKTNQHELAAGGTNVVSACGATHNPWHPARITGGSSGGSGAAVAARVVPLALGSDTGGSIRIPASFCGISGLKPTTGRVSLRGAMVLAPELDTAGPMAVTVEDLALALAVLTETGEPFVQEAAGPATGVRVGVVQGFFRRQVHPEALEAVDEAAGVLAAQGASTRPLDLGDIWDAPEVWDGVAWPEFAVAHGHLLRRPETLYPRTRSVLEYGATRTAVDYLRARKRQGEIRDAFRNAMTEVDVLLTPATPFPAPRADADTVDVGDGESVDVHRGGPARLTRPVNLAGLPALVVPAGMSAVGMPLAIQLIGRAGEESVVLRVGRAFQEATDHHTQAPVPGGARPG